jgi:hypothetical protein
MAVAVPALAEDVRVEHPVVERLGVRNGVAQACVFSRLGRASAGRRSPVRRTALCGDAGHAGGRHVWVTPVVRRRAQAPDAQGSSSANTVLTKPPISSPRVDGVELEPS